VVVQDFVYFEFVKKMTMVVFAVVVAVVVAMIEFLVIQQRSSLNFATEVVIHFDD